MDYSDTEPEKNNFSEENAEPYAEPAEQTDLTDKTETEASATYLPAPAPEKTGKYNVFSLLIFLLTAGGLFLGLIGNYASWLKPSYYFGSSGLNNSLLGFFFTRMRELFVNISAIFTGSAGTVFRNIFSILAAFLVAAVVIATLVCLVVTFLSPKRAKKATAIGGTLALLAYTLLFVWAYCVNSLYLAAFGRQAIDVPVALIACALFIVMTAFAVLENGKKGFFGAGIFLFSLAACFALFFPGSFTETHFGLLTAFKEHLTYNILSLAAVAIAVGGLIVATAALPRKGKGLVRSIVFALQFILVALLAIAGCRTEGSWSLIFFQNGSLLPSLILIIAALGATLLSLLVLLIDHRERARARAAAQAANFYTETSDDVTEEPEAVTFAAEESEQAESGYMDEASLYASAAEETVDPDEADDFLETASEEEIKDADVTPDYFVPVEEEQMSDFEREMLAYAEKKPEEADAERADEAAPVPPYAQTAPASQPFRPINVYTDPSTQYTYDPFINELTPEEKDEFGDLFIACKSGRFGDLPIYHIGGDNAEFFDKVWIRYGMYDMSQNLRDKLFSYLRRYRSKQ